MSDSFYQGIPWQRFMEYISLTADRFSILNELLKEAGLEHKVIDIAGGRHFIIAPPLQEDKQLRRPPIILVAHHDRTEGSPGANDNSAGVFLLIETAMRLIRKNINNWLVI
ncbi:MAG: M28 family peptidase, partial [Treponema sp.]|nr:M28 family peptidase [Treponema sp.]